MAWPIVIATNGIGIPVTEVPDGPRGGVPYEIATNGFGTPVVFVASGGTPVTGVVYNPVQALGDDLIAYWDSSRSDLITQSGGLVSSWKDVVASYDAAQGTAANRPSYSATGLSGKPAIVFDGVDDVLIMASHPFPTGGTPQENWLLLRNDAADASVRDPMVYGGGGFASQLRHQRATTNASQIGVGNGTGNVIVTGSLPYSVGVPRIARAVLDISSRLDIDESAGTPTPTPNTAIGAGQVAIGSAGNGTSYWQGPIAVILVTKPLSETKAAALKAWLSTKRAM